MEGKTLTEVDIRKATHDQLPALIDFITQFVDSGELLPRTIDEMDELIDYFFVAVADGQIVGCAALEIYNRKLAELRSLGVAPLYRGCGIGKRLVQACIELAVEKQVFEVMAISASEWFFQSCGFDYTLPRLRRAFFLQTREVL